MQHALIDTRRARGIMMIRADANDPAAMLAEINKAFEAFKASNEKALKGVTDVVDADKMAKINTDIGSLLKAIDDLNKKAAAAALGGAGDPKATPERRAYSQAFNDWFKTGAGEAGLQDLAVKASMTTQSKPDGGYLVSPETDTQIDRVMAATTVMRQLASVRQIGSDELRKFVNVGGTGYGWVGETDVRAATANSQLKEIILGTMELYAMPIATQKMLDDGTIVDVAQWLADEVNIVFTEQEGAAFVVGDGNKKPRGILAYPTIANASYAWGSIGFIATGNSSGFASSNPTDNLIDLYYALKAGYRNGASWLTSDAVMNTIRKFKDGQGNYIWAPPTGVDMPATILGKPVYSDDNMQALASNAFPVAFADFKRSYTIVDRIGVRILRDPFTNKPYVQFYITKRVGGGLTNFESIKLLKCA